LEVTSFFKPNQGWRSKVDFPRGLFLTRPFNQQERIPTDRIMNHTIVGAAPVARRRIIEVNDRISPAAPMDRLAAGLERLAGGVGKPQLRTDAALIAVEP
jgi:hypothetical protein